MGYIKKVFENYGISSKDVGITLVKWKVSCLASFVFLSTLFYKLNLSKSVPYLVRVKSCLYSTFPATKRLSEKVDAFVTKKSQAFSQSRYASMLTSTLRVKKKKFPILFLSLGQSLIFTKLIVSPLLFWLFILSYKRKYHNVTIISPEQIVHGSYDVLIANILDDPDEIKNIE